MRLSASVLVFASLVLFAGEARAHLDLLSPKPRTSMLKNGPCGAGPADPRGPTVAIFKPGETITVTWDEYVDHPGHFRIAFDEDGQDGFFDPKGFDDVSGGPGVLMDGIADKEDGGVYEQKITLPNVECDNCVLQVIQMMTDKSPFGDGNDIYYQCADIALVNGVEDTTGTSGATDGGGTGGETGGSTAGEASGGTAAPSTTGGEEPTAGTADSSSGTVSSSGGDTTTDGGDEDGGCGCRSGDADGLGWLAGVLMLPLLRRRRAG